MPEVLIVDHEAGLRTLLRVILEEKGYSVETAEDAEASIRQLHRDPAKLVICSVAGPSLDGQELIQHLRREKPALDIIAIVVTGVEAGVDLDLLRKLGVRDTFKKPIDREKLMQAVDDCLSPSVPGEQRDTTGRTSAREIAAVAGALAAENNLRPLVEAVPHFFWILDSNRQVVLANSISQKVLGLPQVEALHGRRPGEALGCRNAGLDPRGCGGAAACTTCGALKAIANCQEGKADTQECRLLREEDGGALDLRVWTRQLEWGDGNYIVFQAQDITHEKRREVLERTFFHDLLNVAGGLQNGLGMLAEMDPEAQAEILPTLITAGKGLLDEIEAHKDLLAIEAGTYDAGLETFGTHTLLQGVIDRYRHHPAAEDRRLKIDGASPDIALTSDRRLMIRVVGNMVKNALEASDPGDGVTMGCRVEGDGNTAALWVHNPQLMPLEVQQQVFQRSYSTKGRGRGMGTFGMRLLTERYLRGTVDFTSSATSGTTFTARYPVAIDTICAA
jgi:signal transduction histidine kinase/CheY-like chemotaxis protein